MRYSLFLENNGKPAIWRPLNYKYRLPNGGYKRADELQAMDVIVIRRKQYAVIEMECRDWGDCPRIRIEVCEVAP